MSKKYSPSNILPTVLLLGRSNVGKSTLFNRLIGEKLAIENNLPGTTRDWNEYIINIKDQKIKIIDSAGFVETDDKISLNIKNILDQLIKDVDLILWVIDGSNGLNPQDLKYLQDVRTKNKETWVVVNKCDNSALLENEYEFYQFGFPKVLLISALHDKNIFLIKKHLEKWLSKIEYTNQDNLKPKINFAVIGKTNVGKSSIINSLLETKRSITSDQPNTTRDSIKINLTGNDFNWNLQKDINFSITDTAGLQSKKQINSQLEKNTFKNALKTITNSDVVLLVLDASKEITRQDLRIAGLAIENGANVIILVNKWDLVSNISSEEKNQEKINIFINKLLYKAKFLHYSPIIFASTKNGYNIQELKLVLKDAWVCRNKIVDQKKIDEFAKHSINFPSRIRLIKQVDVNPPTFKIDNITPFTTSEIKYLKNRIKEEFDLFTTPILIKFKN